MPLLQTFYKTSRGSCDAVQVLVGCMSSVSWYTRWEPLLWQCHVIASLSSFCPSVRESCTPRYSRCRTYSLHIITRLTWYAGLDKNSGAITSHLHEAEFNMLSKVTRSRLCRRKINEKALKVARKETNTLAATLDMRSQNFQRQLIRVRGHKYNGTVQARRPT